MSILTPGAWEDVSTVTLVIVFALVFALALKNGWVVLGTSHREILKIKDELIASKDDTIADVRGRAAEDQRIIRTQADTISDQRVSGQLTAHITESIREALGRNGISPESSESAGTL